MHLFESLPSMDGMDGGSAIRSNVRSYSSLVFAILVVEFQYA